MKYIGLALSLFMLSACSAPYQPQPRPMQDRMIHAFSSDAEIQIVNNQLREGTFRPRRGVFMFDYRETTNKTIALLQDELAKNGVMTRASAGKVLKISVDELFQARRSPPFVKICVVSFSLETGDGFKKNYQVRDATGINLFNGCDFALTKAVAAIINDQAVRSYIDPAISQ